MSSLCRSVRSPHSARARAPRETRPKSVLGGETRSYAGFRIFSALAPRADAASLLAATRANAATPLPESSRASKAASTAEMASPAMIAALPCVTRLPPAKQRVFEAFFQGQLSVEAIAKQRSVRETTIVNYLADALKAGLEYDWTPLEAFVGASNARLISATLLDHPSAYAAKRNLPDTVDFGMIFLVKTHEDRLRQAARPPDATAAEQDEPDPKPGEISDTKIYFV